MKSALEGAYKWLRETLASTLGAIKEALANAYTWLSATFGPAITAVKSALEGAYKWLRETLAGILAGAKEALANTWTWLRDVAGPAIAALPATIWQALVQWWSSITASVAQGWRAIVGGLNVGMDWVISTVAPTVAGWFEGLGSIPAAYLGWVSSTAGTDLALQPSRALSTVGSLYLMAMSAGTLAHGISTALNAVPTLNFVGASQLAAYVAEAASFEPLTRATYGVLLNECLAWPLRYHWNQQLRPRIPTEGEIFVMGRKRGLDYTEFSEAMAYQGLPQVWIDRIYTYFWTDPSPYWLLRMSETGNPEIRPSGAMMPWVGKWLPGWANDPWAWYKMKLMLAGFEDTDIPAFIDGFRSRMVGPAVTQVKTSVRAMLREAYWDRADAAAVLRPLGVREEELELLALAEEIDYQNRYLDGEVSRLVEAFRKGEVSRQDLSLALSAIIVKPERVAQLVAREEVRALPKPKPVAPAKEDPLVKSLTTSAVGSWTKAYRDWRIAAADLELGLTIVLQDPALAARLVGIEETRYRPPPAVPAPPPEDPVVAASRRASIASWIKQFRDGDISIEEMELGLSPLIDDRERLLQIRQLEELRARPAPEIIPPYEEDPLLAQVREETVRGHLEMFRKRQIALAELYAYLVADGLAEALARATALTQAFKRLKAPALDSPYFQQDRLRDAIDEHIDAYTRQVERRQITIDEYRAYLLAAGVDPDVVQYLVDTQEVRAFLRQVPAV